MYCSKKKPTAKPTAKQQLVICVNEYDPIDDDADADIKALCALLDS